MGDIVMFGIEMPVTTVVAALTGLLLVVVSYRVAIHRLKNRIEIGTGGDTQLERLIRVQGNLTEYAPITLILLGLLEIHGVDQTILISLGVVFVGARLAHAHGFGTKPGKNPGRFYGMIATWLVILVASGLAIHSALLG